MTETTLDTYRGATFISTDAHVTEPIELYAERVAGGLPRPGAAHRDRGRLAHAAHRGPASAQADDRATSASSRSSATGIPRTASATRRATASPPRSSSRRSRCRRASRPTTARCSSRCAARTTTGRARCSARSHRLLAVGLVPMLDIDAAIVEAQRLADAGFRSLFLPARVPQRPYNDPEYDRFWAVAQDLGLPLTFHSGTGHEPRVVRGPGRRGRQLPARRPARRADGAAADGRGRGARPVPGPAAGDRRDRRGLARLDHDAGRPDLRGPPHVRQAEAVAEAERAHPPPGPRHLHVRPGGGEQPRASPASRRSCGATTTRTPRARGRRRRRSRPSSSPTSPTTTCTRSSPATRRGSSASTCPARG